MRGKPEELKYKIGDFVLVSHKVEVDYDFQDPPHKKAFAFKLSDAVVCRVVGVKIKYIGKYWESEWHDAADLVERERVYFYLVASGYCNPPFMTDEDYMHKVYPTFKDIPTIRKDTPFTTRQERTVHYAL